MNLSVNQMLAEHKAKAKAVVQQYTKSGVLYKLGFSSGKWQKRKVRCTSGVLKYYLSMGKERGVIPLATATIEEVNATSTFSPYMTSQHSILNQPVQRDFCFSVKSVDIGNSPLIPDLIPIPNFNLNAKERIYLFAASSEPERADWIRCLKGMVENAGAAMSASGGLAGLGNTVANANALTHTTMKMANEITQQVDQYKQQVAQSGGPQLNVTSDLEMSAAVGLIIKLGPNRCGFVVLSAHSSAKSDYGIQEKRDVIVGMNGTRLQPYDNPAAALIAYRDAKVSSFQSRGSFTITLCDAFNGTEREVTLHEEEVTLGLCYQENTPGRLNDYFVEVWRSLGGGSFVSAGHVRYMEQPSPANHDLHVEVWSVVGGGFSMMAGRVPFFSYHGAPQTNYLVELHRSVGGGMMMNIGEKTVLPTRYG